MAVRVYHTHQTSIPDDPDYDVGSDEWNADHTVTGLGTLAEGFDATDVPSNAVGTLSSTDVQSALAELDSEKLAASSYTAADVLSKLITVDGSGSGLDADLLDGHNSNYFMAAITSVDNVVPRFDGTGGALQTSLWLINDAGALSPTANDGGALGTTALSVSDAFWASGATQNWANGDVVLTHQTSGDANLTLDKSMLLDFGAVTSGFTGLTLRQADTGSNSSRLTFYQDSSSPAASDQLGQVVAYGRDSAANVQLYGKLGYRIDDPTSGSEDSAFFVNIFKGGASYNSMYIDSAGVNITDYTNCANTVTIAMPTLATAYAYGLRITQAGRGTSSSYIEEPDVQYEHYWNRIDVNASGEKVNPNPAASTGTDVAFCVRMGVGSAGGTSEGQKVAVEGLVNINDITNDGLLSANWCGGSFICSTSDSVTLGTNTTASGCIGYVFGANLIGTLGTNCQNYYTVTSAELLSGMMTGSTCRYHVGVRIVQWNTHAVDPAALSAGIQIGAQSGGKGWKHYGIVFDEGSDGFIPVDPGTGYVHGFQSGCTLIGAVSGTPTMTVTNGIDFSGISITQYAFSSFGAQITGGGGGHFANIGFSAGAGGQVTQSTNKTTAVTLDHPSGQITLASGNIVSGSNITFQVNNSAFTSTRGDTVMVKHQSGGSSGAYVCHTSHSGTNAFNIVVENVSGSDKNETPVIAFNVIRGSTS